jgi:hypothetical protein
LQQLPVGYLVAAVDIKAIKERTLNMAGRPRNNKVYAIYSGDTFLALGTLDEIAAFLGVKRKTIQFYMQPIYKKRRKDKEFYVVIEVED